VVVGPETPALYRGPEHRWQVPPPGRPWSLFLFALALFVLLVEGVLLAVDFLYYGFVRGQTARSCGATGVVLLVLANLKSIALALRRDANESLAGLIDLALRALWPLHFWLNPLGVVCLGLFLLVAPVAQPPFYYMAYGILVWQVALGLLARRAVPLKGAAPVVARIARASHSQPAIFVVLAVLVVAGFVSSLFN
jgi:hypothetical protein